MRSQRIQLLKEKLLNEAKLFLSDNPGAEKTLIVNHLFCKFYYTDGYSYENIRSHVSNLIKKGLL